MTTRTTADVAPARRIVPLRQRKADWILLGILRRQPVLHHPYGDPASRDELLLRKINSTELTETARRMTLPPPGRPVPDPPAVPAKASP